MEAHNKQGNFSGIFFLPVVQLQRQRENFQRRLELKSNRKRLILLLI